MAVSRFNRSASIVLAAGVVLFAAGAAQAQTSLVTTDQLTHSLNEWARAEEEAEQERKQEDQQMQLDEQQTQIYEQKDEIERLKLQQLLNERR